MLNAETHGAMVFHILQNDYHRPLVDGKCNRDNIEEQIVVGMYSGEVPALSEYDVDMICSCINDLIVEHN